MAKLLDPERYGALSLAIIFTALAEVFVQRGFNTALIQNEGVTKKEYSSVLWISRSIATILYLLRFLATPIIAAIYKMPYIVAPFRVLVLMLFSGALNSVQLTKVSRELDFKKIFYSNVSGIMVSGLVGIIIACLGGGLWALVGQIMLNKQVICIVMCVPLRELRCLFL